MGACMSSDPPLGSSISAPRPAFLPDPPPRIVSSDGKDIAAIRDAFEAHLNRIYLRLHAQEKRQRQREKDRADRKAKRDEEAKAEEAATEEIASSTNHIDTRTQSQSSALEGALDGRRTSSQSSLRQRHSGASSTPSTATAATLSPAYPITPALPSAVTFPSSVATPAASEDDEGDESLDRLDDIDIALPATALGWETPVMVVPGALAWPPGILHRVCAAEAERPESEPPLDPEVELEKRKAEIARECEDLDPKCTTIFPASHFRLVVYALPPFAENNAKLHALLPAQFQGLQVWNAAEHHNLPHGPSSASNSGSDCSA